MRDELLRRAEQQIKATRRTGVRRASGARGNDNAVALFSEHAKEKLRALAPATSEYKPAPGKADPEKQEKVLRLYEDWVRTGFGGPVNVFDLTVPIGSTVFAPPYDEEW